MDRGDREIFGFERGYAGDLHFLPLAIRYRLDLAGLKIGLEAWLKMPVATRFALAAQPIGPGVADQAFASMAQLAHREATGGEPGAIPRADAAEWSRVGGVPRTVADAATRMGKAIGTGAWEALSELQRYSLLKLAGSRRNPETFGMAYVEFFGAGP